MQQSDGRRSTPAVGASKACGFASQWDDEFFSPTFCHRAKKKRKRMRRRRRREEGKRREKEGCRERGNAVPQTRELS